MDNEIRCVSLDSDSAHREIKNIKSASENIICQQNFHIDDYAIVFAGGGAKGAWQIGVLKELIGKNILKGQAGIVAGTSVGALNAVLYAQSPTDLTHAIDIWTKKLEEINVKCLIDKIRKTFFSDYFFTGWQSIQLFSNSGLKELIKHGLNDDHKLQMETFVYAYNKTDKKAHNEELKKLSIEEQRQWLLASTAIPLIFPAVKIGSKKYSDGGFGWDTPFREHKEMVTEMNNAPVDFIINRNGPKKILLLALSQIESTYLLNAPDDFVIYPIMPSRDLGSPLDFKQKHIRKLIKQGEEDCRKWLEERNSVSEIERYRKNDNILKKLQKKIDIAQKTFKKISNLNGDWTQAQEKYEGFWWFLKFLENSGRKKSDLTEFIENFLRSHLFCDLPQKDDIISEKEKLIQCLKEYCKRDSRIKNLLDSIVSHEKGTEKKPLLSYSQAKAIIADLPNEKRQCILDIYNQFKCITACINELQKNISDDKFSILEFWIIHLKNEIEKFFPETYSPPLEGFNRNFNLCTNDFIGRKKELETLKENIDKNPGKIIILHGYFGTGKKSIVRKFTEIHKDDYQGGILHIKDASKEKTITDAVRSELQRYDSNKLSPVKEVAIKYIENKIREIPGKKLIILENVEDVRNFFSEPSPEFTEELSLWKFFLDPEHFSVIATSNDSKGGTQKHIILQRIGAMSDEDAREMLGNTFDEQKTKDIMLKVRNNPWALHFACKNFTEISEDCDLSKKELTKIIDEELPQVVMNEFVKKYVQPAFIDLPDEEQKILIYASLLDQNWICSSWLSDKENNRTALKSLHQKAWISRTEEWLESDKDDRQVWYSMLENTRKALWSFNKEKLPQYGRELCNFIIEKERNGYIFSMRETEALANIYLLWSTMPWKNDILPILCSLTLVSDLGGYLTEYQLYTLRPKVCEAAKKIVEGLTDIILQQKNRASLKIYEGHIKLDEGKIEEALELYTKAYEIRKDPEIFGADAPETLLPLSYIATALGKSKQWEKAEDQFKACINECKKRQDMLQNASGNEEKATLLETMARLYKRYADCLHEKGDKDHAEKNYRLACSYAIRGKNVADADNTATPRRTLWVGNFYFSLGKFYKDSDEPLKAVKALKKSLLYLQNVSSEQHPHPNIKKINEILKTYE